MMAKRAKPTPMHVGRPAGNGPVPVAAVVADPYDGQPLKVVKNAKASAIMSLHARGRLGPDKDAGPRLEAAERFRRILERAEIGGSRGIDYERTKVDVSFRYRGVPDATIDAVKQLAAIRKALRRHYIVVEKVAGHGFSLDELGRVIDGGVPSWRLKKFLAQTLIDGLDKLIEHFGTAQGLKVVPIRAERA